MKIKSTLRTLIVSLLFVGGTANAILLPPYSVNVLSDNTWKSNASAVAHWQYLGFDDSGWSNARAPYPLSTGQTAQTLLPGTAAKAMWHDPESASVYGTEGSNNAYFRKTFFLDISDASASRTGLARVFVDDDFELYVNDHLAYTDNNGVADKHLIDFSSLLRNGFNAFAVHAADGRLSQPHDQVYEMFLFDGLISVGARRVPEPSSVLLLSLGLLGLLHRRVMKRATITG